MISAIPSIKIDLKIKQKVQRQLKQRGFPNKKVMASLDEVIDDLSGKKKLKGAKNINELDKLLDE